MRGQWYFLRSRVQLVSVTRSPSNERACECGFPCRDIAIVWKRLERYPENSAVWEALKARVGAENVDQENIIVGLFNELVPIHSP